MLVGKAKRGFKTSITVLNGVGLADNPELIRIAKEYIDKYGLGLASVRFICGTQNIHKELEQKVSKFHNTEDTILYTRYYLVFYNLKLQKY